MAPITLLRRLASLAALCALAAPAVGAPKLPDVHHGFTVGPSGFTGPLFSNGNVVIGGPVRGDVRVVDGSITFAKGGSVTGEVMVSGGGYENSVGAPVGSVRVLRDLPAEFSWMRAQPAPPAFDAKGWFDGCLVWAVLALVVSVVAQLAAPRRSYVVHTAVDARPWMMGLLGLATYGAAGILLALMVLLLRSPISAPLGAVIIVVIGLCLTAVKSLGYGASLEHFGAGILRRLHRPGAGPIASRSTAVGVLFGLKLIPIVGFATVVFDLLLLLSGVGAAVHTGLGSSRGWLAARMRTQVIDAGV